MISSSQNLVRVGNVTELAQIENDARAKPLSDQMLTSGYVALDGSALSVENLQVSSGSVNFDPSTLNQDTYGTYAVEFDADYTGTVYLSYDIVSQNGESVTVTRELEVVDNISAETGAEIFKYQWGWDRSPSDGQFVSNFSNSSTFVREVFRSAGPNRGKWDPATNINQDRSISLFSQQLWQGLFLDDDPNVPNEYTSAGDAGGNLVSNLTAANGTFSRDRLGQTGTVTYTPNDGFAGYDVITFDFKTKDGEFVTINRTIKVNLTNAGNLTVLEPEDTLVYTNLETENLNDFLLENGEGYYRKIGDILVKVDPSTLLTEDDLIGVYYCAPDSTNLYAQFMLPDAGGTGVADVAPNLGETTPPSPGSYPQGTLFEDLCVCVDQLPAFQDPFEGYDPLNSWQPQRRVEINPGGPAADVLGDEIVINDANGRLFGINNRASDSTFDDITGVAFVMGAEGAFDDGSIAGDEYVGTLEFDLKEGYRTTANFNSAQLAPISGLVSPEGTLDGALVSTETGEVLQLFENVSVF